MRYAFLAALALSTLAASPARPIELTDAQASDLGAFTAEKLDANAAGEELERAIVDKLAEVQKATTTEKKEDPAPAKKKGKKKGKKGSSSDSNSQSSDVIRNGLNNADRIAFGRFIATEIGGEKKGATLIDDLKKELARLRDERSKASTTADAPAPAKKKKKKNT